MRVKFTGGAIVRERRPSRRYFWQLLTYTAGMLRAALIPAALSLFSTLWLAGCGQTGVLYLPSDAEPAAVPAADEDPESTSETEASTP